MNALPLRAGERPWTFAQARKNDAIHFAVRAALAVLLPLPPRLLRAAGRALGLVAYAFLGSARRTAEDNLRLALPNESPRARALLARRAFVNLGGLLGDTVALLRPNVPFRLLELPDQDRRALAEARALGRGVLFASAHLGPWEHVAASLVAHGVPLTTIAREAYDPRLTALFDRLRAPRKVAAIYRGREGAAAKMLRVLRRGEVLGIPMDLKTRVPCIRVPFLGHDAETPVGPARLALRTGAQVVVGTSAPGGRIRIERVRTDDLAPGALGESLLTARINALLSERILAMPEAWVWMHPRYGQVVSRSLRPVFSARAHSPVVAEECPIDARLAR